MPSLPSRRGLPDVFDFEGSGARARAWLDAAYGTSLRLAGPFGTVRHHRVDHGSVVFDHLRIEGRCLFDADALPALVVVDLFGGTAEYSRDGVTDRVHDGDSVLISGWDMGFSGTGDHVELRSTTLAPEALAAAVDDVVPGHSWHDITFGSYLPQSPAAGARWRATVDQLSARPADTTSALGPSEAARLLAHTLLQTFPNDLVAPVGPAQAGAELEESTPSTIRRAMAIIESHAVEGLNLEALARECEVTPRALQYAFRKHLGCTPLAYLRRVRLDLVRQSLRHGAAPTVSDAAAGQGFFNPGRFAKDYRQVFDENPGQTLHRSNT